jgi:hypothetical protein
MINDSQIFVHKIFLSYKGRYNIVMIFRAHCSHQTVNYFLSTHKIIRDTMKDAKIMLFSKSRSEFKIKYPFAFKKIGFKSLNWTLY